MSDIQAKPYEQIQVAVDQWRAFDDPARSDLKGKRNRRRLASLVGTLLLFGVFGQGLVLMGLMREHNDSMLEYSSYATRINEQLADNQQDVLEDIQSRLEDRRAQLSALTKQIEASDDQVRALVDQRSALATELLAAPETDGESQGIRETEERIDVLSTQVTAESARLLQMRESQFTVERSISRLEGELEHVTNAVAEIARERSARQKQVDDDRSPVTALQADLESAERRVNELIETNESLRSTTKRMAVECDAQQLPRL